MYINQRKTLLFFVENFTVSENQATDGKPCSDI